MQLLHLRPNPPRQEDGMARNAAAADIDRPCDRQIRSKKGRRHAVNQFAGHAGLVAEKDRRRIRLGVCRTYADTERCALTLSVVGIQHDPNRTARRQREGGADVLGAVAEHDDDLIETGASGRIHHMLEKTAIAKRQELLGLAHSAGSAGGQDDAGKKAVHFYLCVGH